MNWSADDVIGQRFATQRLTTAPFADPADVVRLLLCVQAQDPPLARFSLGLRAEPNNDASVRLALDDGRLVRTHILRPTWHFVAADDLRWLLALTSTKVESSLASRHRQLDVDAALIDRAHEALMAILAERRHMTAREIGEEFAALGLPERGEVVRHLLLVAELRGVVCSAPSSGATHSYGLVDELVEPSPPIDRDTAVRQLVHRFFRGHGPASEQDLRRWTTLTLAEIRQALGELDDLLESVTCGDTDLWFDPASIEVGPLRRRVFLLPTFDEAYLPYRGIVAARSPGHPRGEEPHAFAEAGGGVVLVDGSDAGWWKRTVRGRRSMTIRLGLATGLDAEQRRLVELEADNLAAFFDRETSIELIDP